MPEITACKTLRNDLRVILIFCAQVMGSIFPRMLLSESEKGKLYATAGTAVAQLHS